MQTSEEAECIGRILAGETHLYRDLIDTYQAQAYRTALRLMGHAELAEEMTQDAFVKAFQQLRRFRGEARFGTWLHQILTRRCLAELRLRRHQHVQQQVDIQEGDVYTQNHAVSQLEATERRKQVEWGLSQLPPKERLVLQLFYLDELSIKEIQEQTGWSNSQVKVQLHRARKRFRRLLPQGEEETPPIKAISS